LRKNKSKLFKMLFLFTLIIVFSFILTLSLSGCRPSVSPEEEASTEEVIDDTEETPEINDANEEDSSEEITDNTEEDNSLAQMEITGNINIFSGLELSDEVLNSRPVAVMIENSPDSRPQSGLINADIVFEVVDEYGVTRYVAVFSSKDTEIMGPVRSARIYYAEIARSFDPIYSFWGTYPDAYPSIIKLDMDVLDANSDAYVPYTNSGWRDKSRSNVTEHTAFMSTLAIKEDAEEFGYSLEGGQSPLNFKLDAVESERGSISDIVVDFSHDSYKVGFEFDQGLNKYYKSTGGEPHIDFESQEQLSVNNVIVLMTDIDGPIDQYGHMVVRTTGSHEIGDAYFFMDGNVIEGTWGRTSAFDSFEFKDKEGNMVLFNRGCTWICMIPGIDRLIY
jgi:hypothetical protein